MFQLYSLCFIKDSEYFYFILLLHLQTHISENKEEIQAVKDIFPEFSSYAEVYDAAGLLTNKVYYCFFLHSLFLKKQFKHECLHLQTVLAHGIYLSDSELDIIHKRKSAVIHCPSSNTCLKSGLCDVRRLQAANVKVGLGTGNLNVQTEQIIFYH